MESVSNKTKINSIFVLNQFFASNFMACSAKPIKLMESGVIFFDAHGYET